MAPGQQEVARLYDAYGASLYRYALMILGSREAAEDAIHQVFVALLSSRTSALTDEERYLQRAVRNACYSALRHQKVRQAPALDDELLESAAADGPAVTAEERMALAAAILDLPAEQREVIHLHVFEGRTFMEVAAISGESLNTIASRYRYALERMKAMLTGVRR